MLLIIWCGHGNMSLAQVRGAPVRWPAHPAHALSELWQSPLSLITRLACIMLHVFMLCICFTAICCALVWPLPESVLEKIWSQSCLHKHNVYIINTNSAWEQGNKQKEFYIYWNCHIVWFHATETPKLPKDFPQHDYTVCSTGKHNHCVAYCVCCTASCEFPPLSKHGFSLLTDIPQWNQMLIWHHVICWMHWPQLSQINDNMCGALVLTDESCKE